MQEFEIKRDEYLGISDNFNMRSSTGNFYVYSRQIKKKKNSDTVVIVFYLSFFFPPGQQENLIFQYFYKKFQS